MAEISRFLDAPEWDPWSPQEPPRETAGPVDLSGFRSGLDGTGATAWDPKRTAGLYGVLRCPVGDCEGELGQMA